MTTIARRTIRSSPYRDTVKTWEFIVELLVRDNNDAAKSELLSVTGVAASVLAERGAKDSAVVVSCNGPKTRIYCLYDDDALDASAAAEDPLGYHALAGNWSVSLPCPADDLEWVNKALGEKTERVSARDMSEKLGDSDNAQAGATPPPTLDLGKFLKQ